MIAKRVLITGRVQGVSFRWYTLQEANRLGVDGWVRNLPDGRVESLIEGAPDDVERMVEWMRAGPPAARVDDVVVESTTPSAASGFHITG